MNITRDELRSLLLRGAWFKALSEEHQSGLLAIGHVKRLQSGEALFYRGDPDTGVYAVLSGHVRVSGLNARGEESILTFVEAGAWFGELALFDQSVRTHDAFASGDTSLFHIPSNSLSSLLDERPDLWRQFGLMLAQKLRLSFELIEDLTLLPARKRMAKRLVQMTEGYAQDGRPIGLSIDQASLASMLSISRQTANQILGGFTEKGWVSLSYSTITVNSVERLKAFIQADD